MATSKICFDHSAQVFLLFNEKEIFLTQGKTIFKTYLRLVLILKAVFTGCFVTELCRMILQNLKMLIHNDF